MKEIYYLENLKKSIEILNEIHHKKILQIIIDNNITISENSNGCFVNLTDIDDTVIDKIQDYLKFISEQTNDLNEIEEKKKEIRENFFS